MKKSIFLCLILSLFLVSGCATIMKGSDQMVTFDSKPDGAKVFVNGRTIGVTPVSINLKKNKYDSVMFKKEGYGTVTMPIEKKFDAVAILNVFWDFSTTDVISGAIVEYSPNHYYVELEEKSADWKYNNHKLDRNHSSDLLHYVLREYYRIKQNSESDEMSALLHLIVAGYNVSTEDAKNKVEKLLNETSNPVEFMKLIEEAF